MAKYRQFDDGSWERLDTTTNTWVAAEAPGVAQTPQIEVPPIPPSLVQPAPPTRVQRLGKAALKGLDVVTWPFQQVDRGVDAVVDATLRKVPALASAQDIPLEATVDVGAGVPGLSGQTVTAAPIADTVALLTKMGLAGPVAKLGMGGLRALNKATQMGRTLPGVRNIPSIGVNPWAAESAAAPRVGAYAVAGEPMSPLYTGSRLDVPPSVRGAQLDFIKRGPDIPRGSWTYTTEGKLTGDPSVLPPRMRPESVVDQAAATAEPPIVSASSDIRSAAEDLRRQLTGVGRTTKDVLDVVLPPLVERGGAAVEDIKSVRQAPTAVSLDPLQQARRSAGRVNWQNYIAAEAGRTGFAPPSAAQPSALIPRSRWGTETAAMTKQFRAVTDINNLKRMMGLP